MLDFFETYKWDGRPFLLIGMGPSFSRIKDYDISGYNTLGINKVVREIPVNLCHVIDHYIVDKVRESIIKQCDYLVMPYLPHFGYRPHPLLTLREVAKGLPDSIRSKILGYNLSTAPIQMSKSPIIEANYFNAEASLNLIANLGCKKIKAIGIDGDKFGHHQRAKEFSDHGPCDPRGFDLQWTNMAKTINKFGIQYSNLDGSPLNSNLEKLLEQNLHRI